MSGRGGKSRGRAVPKAPMTESDLERLLYHWPTVVHRTTDVRRRQFALSIRKRARSKDWWPSQKQARVMRRMVDKLFASSTSGKGEGSHLIED